MIRIYTNKKYLRCLIDSGATCNVIGEDQLIKLLGST